MRLEARQDFAGKALDLIHEQIVRQAAAVHCDLHLVGAGAFGGVDDALGDLVGGAHRHVLRLLLELCHRQVAEFRAQVLRRAQILRPHVIGGGGARIPRFALLLDLGEIAVAEQCAVEIEDVRPVFAQCLRLRIGDIGGDAEREMVGRDAVAGLRQARRVKANDVVAQTAGAPQPRRDRDVVRGGELDRFLAADDRHPDRRVRLLHRARPQRDIVVRPELAFVREHLFGPGAGDDVVGFLEAGARLRQRHVVHLVFARDAAGETGDQPAFRQAVEHRQFLGEAQRLMHRQQVAVDQQLQALGALRRRGGHQIGAVHQPVRRAVVLVEADPVIAKAVERLPGVEMLLIGALGRRGIEMALGERVGELGLAALQMVEIGVVGQEIEDKDFHSAASCGVRTGARWPRNARSAVAIAAISAKPQALKKICGGCMPSDRR